MPRVPQNYRSDFIVVETFYKFNDSNDLVVDKIPDTSIDFEFIYSAEDYRTFTAGRKAGRYFNCKPLNESSIEVFIPLASHSLGCGELIHELLLHTPNADFPEAVQNVRIPARTGYFLHKGPSAPPSVVPKGIAIATAIMETKSAGAFVNVNRMLSTDKTFGSIVEAAAAIINAGITEAVVDGVVLTFKGAEGWQTRQFTGMASVEEFVKAANWRMLEGGGSFELVQETGDRTDVAMSQAAVTQELDDINQVLFTQYTTATLTRTPPVIERGVSKEITLTWATRFNGKAETPSSLSVKKGATVLTSEAKADGSVKDTISETTTYNLTVVVKGVTKTASATVDAYYPKYFGCHAVDGVSEQITAAIVKGLVKQALTNTAVGSYSIPVAESNATYVWLCVPSSMSITEVMAGGLEFDIYQETPNVNMAFEVSIGDVSYKCYRSKNKPNAGTINIQIVK